MRQGVMAVARVAFLSSCVLTSPVDRTSLAITLNKENIDRGNLVDRQTIDWSKNEVEVCTDVGYKGKCQREPQYINVCWSFTAPFNNSISSVRFDPSETETAGAMSCQFYQTGDCSDTAFDSTNQKSVLLLNGSNDDLTKTEFNDKLQSMQCSRTPKLSTKVKKSETVTNADDLLCLKLCVDKGYQKCGPYGIPDGIQCFPAGVCQQFDPHLGLSSMSFDDKIYPDGSKQRCELFTNRICHKEKEPWLWLDMDSPIKNLDHTGFNDVLYSYLCYRDMNPFIDPDQFKRRETTTNGMDSYIPGQDLQV